MKKNAQIEDRRVTHEARTARDATNFEESMNCHQNSEEKKRK